MASPQTENGHTKIANELIGALYRFPFTGAQFRVLLWVVRDSYGWRRKKTTTASLKDIHETTGVPRASVGWAFHALAEAGVVARDKQGRYSLNKNYDEWVAQGADLLPLSNRLDRHKAALPSNPLDKPSNPLDTSSNPLDEKGPHYKEFKESLKEKRKKGPAARPALEEVAAYCAERKNSVDPQKWHDHYIGNGWKVGRNPMADWRAVVRTWERNGFDQGLARAASGPPCPLCDRPKETPNAVVCGACCRCKKCGEATPNLKIGTRHDGTKTAWCVSCVKKKEK